VAESFNQQRDALRRRSLRMGALVEELVREGTDSVFTNNVARAEAVIARDAEVDAEEVQIEAEVVRLLAAHPPAGPDVRLLCAVLKINNDLERIADCAVNIAQRVRQIDGRIPAGADRDLRLMDGLVRQMLRWVLQAYGNQDVDLARRVLRNEETVDALNGKIVQELTADITHRAEDVVADLDLIIVAKNIERIADHATNVAEDVVFTVTGEIIRHSGRWSKGGGQPATGASVVGAPVGSPPAVPPIPAGR
jgi:phosphate transport system protein